VPYVNTNMKGLLTSFSTRLLTTVKRAYYSIEMLPNGFPNLVAVTIENWDWDRLPQRDIEVWDALLYPVFLGRTIRSAQANYVKQILDPHLRMDVARAVRTDPNWSTTVLRRIDRELGSITDTLGEGYKRAILNTVAQEVRNLNLSRTLDTALSFFEGYDIGVDLIRRIQHDAHQTAEYVDYATREIHNVGYIKAVIWMYDCGIAYDLVPPNSHVKRFLAECGYPEFGWSRDEPEDWQIFALANRRMREVAEEVSRHLGKPISAKQAQAAVWYLQSCRGLLPRNYSGRLSPRTLTDFLGSMRWDIHDLANRLADVEQLEPLIGDFERFL
jgi:hypothetical protein